VFVGVETWMVALRIGPAIVQPKVADGAALIRPTLATLSDLSGGNVTKGGGMRFAFPPYDCWRM